MFAGSNGNTHIAIVTELTFLVTIYKDGPVCAGAFQLSSAVNKDISAVFGTSVVVLRPKERKDTSNPITKNPRPIMYF